MQRAAPGGDAVVLWPHRAGPRGVLVFLNLHAIMPTNENDRTRGATFRVHLCTELTETT